ncbi:MAG TPA: DUF4124 domain-containing protein [Woeseiaceae bacterium]|nr:DUF4124 domain-containing protein [Woeseiaceae bacterium]
MKCRRATAALLALALTVPAAVLASDIYKWVDENGIVHFGDLPAENADVEIVHISSQPTDPAAVRARIQARSQAGADAAETVPGADALTEEEIAARERERAEKCTMYKERLQKFLTSRRLYREDENGERVYLDEKETLAARAEVQEQVLEYCDTGR